MHIQFLAVHDDGSSAMAMAMACDYEQPNSAKFVALPAASWQPGYGSYGNSHSHSHSQPVSQRTHTHI